MPPIHLDKVLRHAERELGQHASVRPSDILQLYGRFLKQEEHRIKLAHASGEGGRSIVEKRADLITIMLQHVWQGACNTSIPRIAGNDGKPKLALAAVGGFGRGELNPHSDIDILFIYAREAGARPKVVDEIVEQVLYMLWDMGLRVGHASRTLEELVDEANGELKTKTALLESRFISGDVALYETFEKQFERSCINGHEKEYIEWRFADQDDRHSKHGNTVFVQEPHVKNGCGGLRDYHNMMWIARVRRNIRSTMELMELEYITPSERKQMERAYDFVLHIRNQLHYQQKRNGDLLTLYLQGQIANALHYPQRNILRRTEALMREYYQHAQKLYFLCNSLSKRIAQTIAGQRVRWNFLPFHAVKTEKIDVFVVQEGMIEAVETPGVSVFTEDPFRLLRIFLYAQQRDVELGPSVKFRITRRLGLVNKSFIYHKTTREIMLTIMSKKGQVGRILRRMHEIGLLGRIFPEFAPLTCLVQHEFFHRYTADEHTLVCLEMLDRIIDAEDPPFSKYKALFQSIERPQILYLAMLLHDTGKSDNSRNHSEDSAVNAMRVARRMKLAQTDLSMLIFLVDHHLTMSETARRKNLDDDETIIEFARTVRTQERLDMLMLLTFADYHGTDARQTGMDWKELLLWHLYHRTAAALRSQDEFLAAARAEIAGLQQRLTEELGKEIDKGEIDAHFENLPARYFNTLPEPMIATHIRIVHEFLWHQIMDEEAALRPVIRWIDSPEQGFSTVVIVTWDRAKSFARITGAFSCCGMDILSSDIFTREDDIVIDTFCVASEAFGSPIDDRDKKAFQDLLYRALSASAYDFPEMGKTNHRRLSGFEDAEFPTKISFDQASSRQYTLLDLQTADQPGLLYKVALVLVELNIHVVFARITTEKGAALDTFYLTDHNDKKLSDSMIEKLTTALQKKIAS
ncbi:[protein-PII] uridylyltransferase [Verrucomicrobia bacterium LW23]|nr:[protein-PII] uridylyltransferase [Verrucomicrobia bacterium LW23]